MKPFRAFLTVATLALTLLLTVAILTASADPTKKKATPTPTPTSTSKVVTAVDATASTVSVKYMSDSVTHVYKIDGGTTIKLNDATAAIADIKVGMQVTDLSERDPQTLDSISLAPGSGASSSSETSTPKKKKPTPTPAST